MMTQTKHQTLEFSAISSLVKIFGASLFLALCAQIEIPLYFTPIPLSGQTFGMMLVGATLGSRLGALSVLTYIVEGLCGLPVFAGGAFGIMSLLGPSGGYFLGFIVQAYVTGWFLERQQVFHSAKTFSILLLSCALQLGLGVLWLSSFVGISSAIVMGFCPFFFGELIKSLSITAYLKKLYHEADPHL